MIFLLNFHGSKRNENGGMKSIQILEARGRNGGSVEIEKIKD